VVYASAFGLGIFRSAPYDLQGLSASFRIASLRRDQGDFFAAPHSL